MSLELLAITPPHGAPSLDCIERWRDAGVLERRFALLLREPGATAHATLTCPRLVGLRKACGQAGIPMLLSAPPHAELPSPNTLQAEGITGVQLRGDPSHRQRAHARAHLGADALLGCSVHHPPRPGGTWDPSLDYVCAAPVFAPRTLDPLRTKSAAGTGLLHGWRDHKDAWVLALGGVSGSTAKLCMRAGARGLASISTFFGEGAQVAQDLGALVEALDSPDVPS